MANKLILLTSSEGLEGVNAFQEELEGTDIALTIVQATPDANTDLIEGDEDGVLLWITPGSSDDLFMTGRALSEKGMVCINIFPERMMLSREQRALVGKNKSLNLSLVRGDIEGEILKSLEEGNNKKARTQPVVEAASAVASVQPVASSSVAQLQNSGMTQTDGVAISEDSASAEQTEETETSGYQFTSIIIFYVIYYINYYLFGDYRSDTIIFHLGNFAEGAAGLFCLLNAWLGFCSKKWWPILKSILAVIVGIYGLILFWRGFTHIGDLF